MIMAGSGFPALFYGMLGGVLNDVEALEALEQTIDRMQTVHQRFLGINKQENIFQ